MKTWRALTLAAITILAAIASAAPDKIVTLPPDEFRPTAEESVTTAAKYWDVTLSEKVAPSDFEVFVSALPAPGTPGFCVTGVLHRGGPDLKPGYPDLRTGTIIIRQRKENVVTQRRLELSVAQAKEAFDWFWDSRFLDAGEPTSLPPNVIDGVELAIRTVRDQRTRCLQRNAYANPNAEKFYVRLKALLVWTEGK